MLPVTNVDDSDGLQNPFSYNIWHDTNAADRSPNAGTATSASASTWSERINNEAEQDELDEQGRRTSGRTRYPPEYYTMLHEGPHD